MLNMLRMSYYYVLGTELVLFAEDSAVFSMHIPLNYDQ